MYNLFKRILPILKNRLFGTGVSSTSQQTIGSVIYCQTLYFVDSNLNSLNIVDLNSNLNMVDSLSWEINDGCSRNS